MWELLLAMFILGIGGSLHCIGMCGPLVMAIPHAQNRSSISAILYLFSKSLAYAILGSIIGSVGWSIGLITNQQFIAIISGVIIIVVMVFPQYINKFINPNIAKYINKWYARAFQKNHVYSVLILGFLNGLLPCGLIYAALGLALNANDPLMGALMMFTFGIGTMPILFVMMFFKKKIITIRRFNVLHLSKVISVILGVLLIVRGLGLGIPYISPHVDYHDVTIRSCCE